MKRLVYIIAVWISVTAAAQAQLRVFERSPEQLIATLLGRGVVVTNVVFTGTNHAAGAFCSGTGIIGFENGIVLTSGRATNVIGPNDSDNAGTGNDLPGDADLDALIPGFETHDATVLEFDFIPDDNTVQFTYVFGSEEYNEFVGSPFNDVFGFFVNGVNYALLPDSGIPVSINNVNNGFSAAESAGPCMNCEFFIDNVGSNATRNTQLDGLTVVLTFTAPVVPGQLNHMKIAIADAGDDILDSAVFLEAGSLRSGEPSTACITRNARFWFTHPREELPGCVNLKAALAEELLSNCDIIDLGFMTLPAGFRNDDNVRDAEDAVIEALGFFWRGLNRTGELGGTQSQRMKASRLCRERKRLAIELLAALANVRVLGTDPANCGFSSTLLDNARAAATSDRIEDVIAATAQLRAFNTSGLLNDFPAGLFECSAVPNETLRSEARDPTLSTTCPGINDTCLAAEALYFNEDKRGIFSRARLRKRANLTRFNDNILSGFCGVGGPDVIWKITPEVGRPARHFTADTFGSNFDTILTVLQGNCDNLVEVTCSDDAEATPQSKVAFSTDGTNTYFLVVEGFAGSIGKVRLNLTSP